MNFKEIIEQLFYRRELRKGKLKELRSKNKKLDNQIRTKQAEIDLLKRRIRRMERERDRLC